MIRTVAAFGLEATRIEGLTGVWLESPPRKIASIGIHLSQWVSTHGYALNVDLDPAPFTDWITACGLDGYAFTSLARELGRAADRRRRAARRRAAFAEVFDLDVRRAPSATSRASGRSRVTRSSPAPSAHADPGWSGRAANQARDREVRARQGVQLQSTLQILLGRRRSPGRRSPRRCCRRALRHARASSGAGRSRPLRAGPRFARQRSSGRAGPRRPARRRSPQGRTRARSPRRSRGARARSAGASTPRRRAGRSASRATRAATRSAARGARRASRSRRAERRIAGELGHQRLPLVE